jgi:hypothetical protein
MGSAHKLVTFVFCLLLVLPIATFATSDKWCGLMTSIYGMCSPQLIDNYLLMTYNPPKLHKNTQTPIAIPSPKVVFKEAVKEPVFDGLPYRYSWYWNNKEWVMSRLFS